MTTQIEAENKEYSLNRQNWQLVRDLIKGESALKQHDLATVTQSGRVKVLTEQAIDKFRLNRQYLPMPDSRNCEPSNILRYCQYIQRASLFNVVKRSQAGMAGMAFSKPAIINLPSEIEYLLDDADGSGVGLQQQSQEVLNDLLATGREGLLVDYPQTEGQTTLADLEQANIRASIVVYKAESILDWDMIKVNAAHKLSFVKLQECVSKRDDDDIFTVTEVKQFRVLILNSDGQYEQRLYDESGELLAEPFVPLDKNGNAFDYIPFFFIGSVNNRPNVDPAPLIEISEVNLAHYRNSADFEEASFIVGQPTLAVSGLTQAWKDQYFAKGIPFGSRAGLALPQGASADIIQAEENTMPENGMTRKEQQMKELGARLIQSGGGAETAEAARIKHSADASALSVIVSNEVQAYKDAIVAVQQFQTGTEQEFEYKISDDFFETKLSATDALAVIDGWLRGAYTREVMQKKLQSGGALDEDIDLEEMNEVLDNQPIGPNFDEV